jgi:hypothetical protein
MFLVCDINLEPMYIVMMGYADFFLAATCHTKQLKFFGYGNDKMSSDKSRCSGNNNTG